MRPLSVVAIVVVSSLLLACEGPKGPAGPVGPVGLTGPAGPAGPSLQVVSEEGTVLSRNYTEANDSFISIPLGQDGVNEPVVLLLGWKMPTECSLNGRNRKVLSGEAQRLALR